MRVAFVVNEFPVLSETFVLDQIIGLIERGCEVEVFAKRLHAAAGGHAEVARYGLIERAFQYDPPPVHSKLERVARGVHDLVTALRRDLKLTARSLDPLHGGLDALKMKSFYQVAPFVGRPAHDVVHCHFGPSGLLGAKLRALGAIKAPLLTQFHGYDASSYLREHGDAVYAPLFARGELFLCVSERIRQRLLKLGCPEAKTRVHRTGVRVATIAFEPRAPISRHAPRLLSVCRLVEKKGIEYGIRAVAQLVPSYPELNYRIVGDGPERQALGRLVEELGLGAHVEFVDAEKRSAVLRRLSEADVLLAPSVTAQDGDEEGIPVVLMEALAGGLSVVSCHHAGIPELVTHGSTGLLAAERDASALAEQIAQLIEQPAQRAAMCVAGRAKVEAEYDSDRLNEQLYALYTALIGQR